MSLAALYAQAVEAQIRYYDALARLGTRTARAVRRRNMKASRARLSRATVGSPSPVPPTGIVLESEAGSCVVGMFLVENHLAEPVSGSIAPSAFVDPQGHEVRPRLAFSPQVVQLEPGEKTVVRVAAAFDDRLRPGVRYRGTIGVPGTSSASVAVVIRRLVPAAREPRGT